MKLIVTLRDDIIALHFYHAANAIFGTVGYASSEEVIFITIFITARCYASAVLAMALCPSVCASVYLSARPSQVGGLLKQLNVGSHKQHHTIAQGL